MALEQCFSVSRYAVSQLMYIDRIFGVSSLLYVIWWFWLMQNVQPSVKPSNLVDWLLCGKFSTTFFFLELFSSMRPGNLCAYHILINFCTYSLKFIESPLAGFCFSKSTSGVEIIHCWKINSLSKIIIQFILWHNNGCKIRIKVSFPRYS